MTTDERAFIAEAIRTRRTQLERMTRRCSELEVMVNRLNRFIDGVNRELRQLLEVQDVVPEPNAVELGMSPSDFRNMML